MKPPELASGLRQGIPFLVPAHWSPEQALAVFELLDDLREQIWQHYQLQLLELLHEQRLPPEDCASLSLPFDEPPF
jgi:hypothetical protein